MTRRAYLALLWRPDNPAAAAQVKDLADRLDQASDWTRIYAGEGLGVWRPQDAELPVLPFPDGAGVLIGDVFGPSGAPANAAMIAPLRVRPGASAEIMRRLSREVWGPYVALFRARGAAPARSSANPPE